MIRCEMKTNRSKKKSKIIIINIVVRLEEKTNLFLSWRMVEDRDGEKNEDIAQMEKGEGGEGFFLFRFLVQNKKTSNVSITLIQFICFWIDFLFFPQ